MEFRLIIDKSKDEEIVATVHQRTQLTDQIQQLVMEYIGTDKIPAYTEDDVKMLPVAKIACITVTDGKTYAIDEKAVRYRLRLRLYELEAILPESFIRINKSALANESHLERFSPSFGGGVDAVFRCGYREYVSRRCFAKIKRRYDL